MPSPRLFANWTLRAACYLVMVVSGIFTAAHAQQPEAQVGVSVALAWALGAVGTLSAIIVAIWSKNQDRRIEAANATAEEAWAKAHALEVQVQAVRPSDVTDIKRALSRVERLLAHERSISGRHPILDSPEGS